MDPVSCLSSCSSSNSHLASSNLAMSTLGGSDKKPCNCRDNGFKSSSNFNKLSFNFTISLCLILGSFPPFFIKIASFFSMFLRYSMHFLPRNSIFLLYWAVTSVCSLSKILAFATSSFDLDNFSYNPTRLALRESTSVLCLDSSVISWVWRTKRK